MNKKPQSQVLLYQAPDGRTRLEVRLQDETVWLTQAQMAELFQRERSVITKHIRNIFEEGELAQDSVCADFAHTAADGKTYQTVCYNLDVIISVGYRVREEAVVAKNYLTAEELEALNRIVNAYLEFAELQALSRKPMYMRDWVYKLDDFLRMGEREILTHAGTISHEQALRKAELEFEEYRVRQLDQTSQVEKDFDEAVKALPKPRRRRKAD